MVVDKILNSAVVVRLVLLAAVDIVVPEVTFVDGVVGKLGCSIFVGLAIVDSLDSLVG